MVKTEVSENYLNGIKEGRDMLRRFGVGIAREELAVLAICVKDFSADNPIGQFFRGERDFWREQLKAKK